MGICRASRKKTGESALGGVPVTICREWRQSVIQLGSELRAGFNLPYLSDRRPVKEPFTRQLHTSMFAAHASIHTVAHHADSSRLQ